MNQSPPSSTELSVGARRCPECGAENDAFYGRCWLCRAELPAAPEAGAEAELPVASVGRVGMQFSLETLMLTMTLVAVCLGVLLAAPGLGVLLIVVAVPALVRTVVSGRREKLVGQHVSGRQKVLSFLASLGIMALVAVAGVIAFQIACWGSCAAAAAVAGENEGAIWFGIIAGSVVGIAVVTYLFWLSIRRRRPRR